MKLLFSLMAVVATALSLQAVDAQTQPWPTGPVTLVVPFAPGGSTDIAARLMAQQLTARLGQPVIISNRPGSTGVIGNGVVAAAKPDGLTFLFGSGSLAAGPSLFKTLPFDTARDFAPVSQLTTISNILVVNPAVPAKSVREFIQYVKANPGKVNYGSAGPGSLQHVAGALFEKQIGGQMVHIPYKGGSLANTDVIAGRVHAVFGPIVELLPFVTSGSVRVLGVTSLKASPLLPDVPPIAAEVPGYEISTWHGMFAPRGTAPAIVNAMNAAVVSVLAEPALRSRLLELGLEPVGSSPADFSVFFQSEIKRWKELVHLSGAMPE